MLHMHAGHLNEVFAMTHQRTNFAYIVFGTKRGPQQANRMQILKPLTIQHVRLAAGNVMDMLSIDQMDFNATRFQDLKQWYPVHPGGFHSHRVHTTLLQPIRQSMKILGKVGNARTDSVSRSAGTATKISVAPISIPPAFGLMTGKLRSNFRCFRFFVFAMNRLRWSATSQACKKWNSLKRDHRNKKTVARHQCYCARAWDQTPCRASRSKHPWGN